MAKQRGHRANKPNDNFGTINDDTLYRGKYREEVYKDDEDAEENVDATDPAQEKSATPEQENEESFAKAPEESDTDYKKRYDDLKRHYDSKLEEWKKEREETAQTQQVGRETGLSASELPKTPEELRQFKEKYPDVYAIVETISSLRAEDRLKELKDEIKQLKGREQELEVKSAYKELISAHLDFPEIKKDSKFLKWLDGQPKSIADGIYKNNKDAKWAIRVLDLYKADMGITTKTRKQSRDADPATAVTKTTAKDVVSETSTGKKVWKASEIGRLKPWQFEKLETELDAARAEGRIDFRA
jgi:hypothetical protein